MSLLDAARNQFYRIKQLEGPADECRRLLDLGLTPGEEMAVVQSVPFGDPLVVVVRGMRSRIGAAARYPYRCVPFNH